jgi:hypothetical protein
MAVSDEPSMSEAIAKSRFQHVAGKVRFQNPSQEIAAHAVEMRDISADLARRRLPFPVKKTFGLSFLKFRNI